MDASLIRSNDSILLPPLISEARGELDLFEDLDTVAPQWSATSRMPFSTSVVIGGAADLEGALYQMLNADRTHPLKNNSRALARDWIGTKTSFDRLDKFRSLEMCFHAICYVIL